MFLSKVLPADYVFLSLSVATDILGEFKETLEPKTDFTTSNQTGGALLGILWGLLTAVNLFNHHRVEQPIYPKVTTMLMDDAAYYFEASICLLCSVLAVEVLFLFAKVL